MDYKGLFKEKLSKLLFLEIDWEKFKSDLKIPQNIKLKSKEIYIPISSKYVTNNANNEIKINNLPIYYFIEGMLLALGADENLSYLEDYIIIFNNIKDSEDCGKSLVADRIKNEELVESYLILKGLFVCTGSEEFYKKLLLLGETIRESDSGFNEVLLKDIENGKKEFINMPEPYLYKAIIAKDTGDFALARIEINEYVFKGGNITKEIDIIKKDIDNISKYEEAIALLDKSPEESIQILVSLAEDFEKNALIYYYLGVANRKLGLHEKAIYYLNESLGLESGILEVINELGVNYACLKNFEEAIRYFKKGFEASRDIEICTNIIMCYINLGKEKEAKEHLEIAKKLNSVDEVVIDLDRILNK